MWFVISFPTPCQSCPDQLAKLGGCRMSWTLVHQLLISGWLVDSPVSSRRQTYGELCFYEKWRTNSSLSSWAKTSCIFEVKDIWKPHSIPELFNIHEFHFCCSLDLQQTKAEVCLAVEVWNMNFATSRLYSSLCQALSVAGALTKCEKLIIVADLFQSRYTVQG